MKLLFGESYIHAGSGSGIRKIDLILVQLCLLATQLPPTLYHQPTNQTFSFQSEMHRETEGSLAVYVIHSLKREVWERERESDGREGERESLWELLGEFLSYDESCYSATHICDKGVLLSNCWSQNRGFCFLQQQEGSVDLKVDTHNDMLYSPSFLLEWTCMTLHVPYYAYYVFFGSMN
jgi:hypothetical protein